MTTKMQDLMTLIRGGATRGINKKVPRQTFESFLQNGGRIHVLTVPVQHDRPWQEALEAAGPQTRDDCDVRKVGDRYEPTRIGTTLEEVILMKGNYDGFDDSIAWAEHYDLDRIKPRHIFAATEHYHDLHRVLGINPVFIVATEECTFWGDRRVCYVWLDGDKRSSGLCLVNSVGYDNDWLGFASKRKQ